MDLGIEGKKALITGGDSGIGWHTARALLREGVTVVITDLVQGELDEAADRLDAAAGAVYAVAADVTDAASVASLHSSVADLVGAVDILVQAAGITGAQGAFDEIDDEGWAKTIQTDLLGPVRLTREFLPDLRRG
jgi:NAD(P)-dependent dehydrogenase (short-subunit alcohol dehydrogenase family)